MKRLIVYGEQGVLLNRTSEGYCLPEAVADDYKEGLADGVFIFGDYAGIHALEYENHARESIFVAVKESWQILGDSDYAAVVKAVELLEWDKGVRYCSCCGKHLVRSSEISKKCSGCGREYFPQLSPAVIVLVKKGKKALLVRAKTFRRPFHALVAGFVETGENLEECVAREIKEETNLSVKNIRYFGSQSWPFPGQLMVGFTAEWESGEVEFKDGEIVSGGFFEKDSLPQLPTPPSISRILIDSWLKGG